MKIVALLPVKNEIDFLPIYLSSMKLVADEIIALDDNSTDGSFEYLVDNKVSVFKDNYEGLINMSSKRQKLLELGRKSGGTHFIWLDADEAFSLPFIKNGRKIISQLKPGQKIKMKWLFLWKSECFYVDKGSIFSDIFKDFIVCDLNDYFFEDKFLSEGRTQGPNGGDDLVISESDGVVIHYQFVPWIKNQYKQAWYRCNELIKNKNNPKVINGQYSITLDNKKIKLKRINDDWVKHLPSASNIKNIKTTWHTGAMLKLFDLYGIEFFEPLQIWHLETLKEEFVKRVGREPVPQIDKYFKIKCKIRSILPIKIIYLIRWFKKHILYGK